MTLVEFVRLTRRYVLLLLALTCLGGGLAYAYTRTLPRLYTATATAFVLVGDNSSVAQSATGSTLAQSKAAGYVPLFTSEQVAQRVIRTLGLPDSPAAVSGAISVSASDTAPSVTIFVTSISPEKAKRIADTVAEATATEVSLLESNGRSTSGAVRMVPLTTAGVPSEPSSPKVGRLVAEGLGAGLLLGYALVGLRVLLDTRVRRREDVERVVTEGVIGMIPRSARLSTKRRAAGTPGEDAAGEAMRHLRTNLRFADVDHPPRVLLVTSSRPGEGKSTIAADLAKALAMRGDSVLLIDADLRRPRVAEIFDVDRRVGLSQVLAGDVALADAVVLGGLPGLGVLPAGRIPHNPNEILGSERMRLLLEEQRRHSLVVVDSPPVLPVADALALAPVVDGILLVAGTGQVSVDQLERAARLLRGVQGRLLGVVLNRVPQGRAGATYGYESYGYTAKRHWWSRRSRPSVATADEA